MAWIEKTDTARGRRYFVRYEERGLDGKVVRNAKGRPKIRTEKAGPDYDLALKLKAAAERDVEQRPAPLAHAAADDVKRQFLASLDAQRAPQDTKDYYRRRIELLFNTLGHKSLDRWSTQDIEGIITAHPGWVAKRSVGMFLQVCKAVQSFCRGRTPAISCAAFTKGIRAQGEPPPEIDPPTHAEVAATLNQARKEGKIGYFLAIVTASMIGQRLHDILTNRWEEISWDPQRPELRHIPLKRKHGRAKPIPLSPAVLEILREFRATSGLIVPRAQDTPRMAPGVVRQEIDPRFVPKSSGSFLSGLRRIQKRAGIPKDRWASWHDYRRYLGTSMSEAGATEAEIAAALQHKPGSSETRKYVKARDGGTRAGITAVGTALRAALSA